MKRLALLYIVVLAGLRITLAAPEGCNPATAEQLRLSAARAGRWLVDNQNRDGTFLYQSNRDGESLGGYNTVRHAGALLALYQVANRLHDDHVRIAADRGLRWILESTRDGEVDEGGQASLGAAALLASALVERRSVTGDGRYDDVLRALGRFMVDLQRADGGFYVSRDIVTDVPDRVTTSPYYPGEALWAIARLAALFPDEGWERPAGRAATFIATKRDEVEDVLAPPLNDHWASYGFAEMAAWDRPGITADEAHYASTLFGRFSLLIRNESARDQSRIAGLTHGPARRSAALGTWVEGQTALARLALADQRLEPLSARILASARCGAGVLVDRQADDGAWYAGGETRMDDQQHAISGLLYLAELS